MFSKKVLFPLAAVAMASFVACGDDSSSSASNDVAPASVKTFMDIGDIPCSDSQNFCSIVLVEERNDYYQCNGQWNMMLQGKDTPLTGCENAAPATDPAATPAETPAADPAATPAETPAADPAATPAETPATDPAATPAETPAADPAATPAETPAADPAATPAETPAADPAATPAETPAAAVTGGKAACQVGKMCTEGPAELASGCTAEEGETLLDACPAGGEACDIGEAGITMYFYEGAEMSCEDYKAMIAAFTEMAQ